MLKDPVLYSWATEQINNDWEEKSDIMKSILEVLQPWLNYELYSAVKVQKEKEENKLFGLAKTTDRSKIDVSNTYDTFMKNLGIDVKG